MVEYCFVGDHVLPDHHRITINLVMQTYICQNCAGWFNGFSRWFIEMIQDNQADIWNSVMVTSHQKNLWSHRFFFEEFLACGSLRISTFPEPTCNNGNVWNIYIYICTVNTSYRDPYSKHPLFDSQPLPYLYGV